MNIVFKIAGLAGIIVLPMLLAGCATFGDGAQGSSTSMGIMKTSAQTRAVVSKTSATVSIAGPYDAALSCIAQIPETHKLQIAVGNIADQTGKADINSTDGTGSFIGNGASGMFNSALAQVGVQLKELSPEYRADIDWLGNKGVKGGITEPTFVLMGGVDSLDFLPGTSAGFQIFGFGPQSRSYTALGSMDTRLVTMPQGKLDGGIVAAHSSAVKQFAAVESKAGFGAFLGAAPNVTYASFEFDSGQREPMQMTLRFLVDYEVVDLLGNFIESNFSNRRGAVAQCRQLLEIPVPTGTPVLKVASAG